MVSVVGTERYGAGRVRDGSTRNEERLVGRSASGTAVGVTEAVTGVSASGDDGLTLDALPSMGLG